MLGVPVNGTGLEEGLAENQKFGAELIALVLWWLRRDKRAGLESWVREGAMEPDAQLPRELEGGEGRAMVADDRVRRRITTPSDFPEELSNLAREYALILEPA